MIIHTVKSGDTVYSISKQYSVPESRIITDNDLDTTKRLSVGQTIIISQPSRVCTVLGGDTLSGIASRNGISVLSLLQNNPNIIISPFTPSQTLNIEYPKDSQNAITVSAYTGSASANEIERYMPYVSSLHIQNAAFISKGKISILKNAEQLTALSRQYHAKPILSLGCTDERGRLKADCFDSILSSPNATEAFIASTINAVKNGGFSGLELQLCYGDDSSLHTLYDLILALGGMLKENGLELVIPYMPEVMCDNGGDFLCDVADSVPLWSYIWDDESKGMPASPLDKIEHTLEDKAISKHRDKITLGIPTFGTLYSPTARGYRKKTVDAYDGIRATQDYHVSSELDSEHHVPFVRFSERAFEGAPKNILYYEDAQSLFEKLSLVDKHSLGGVNVMSLEYSLPVLWQILNQKYNIVKY